MTAMDNATSRSRSITGWESAHGISVPHTRTDSPSTSMMWLASPTHCISRASSLAIKSDRSSFRISWFPSTKNFPYRACISPKMSASQSTQSGASTMSPETQMRSDWSLFTCSVTHWKKGFPGTPTKWKSETCVIVNPFRAAGRPSTNTLLRLTSNDKTWFHL